MCMILWCSPDQVLQEQLIRKEQKAMDRRRTGDGMRNGGLVWTSGLNDPEAGSSTSIYCCDRRASDRRLTGDGMRNGGLVSTSGWKAGSSTSMYCYDRRALNKSAGSTLPN